VSIGPREGGAFGLVVKLMIEDKSLAGGACRCPPGTHMRRSVPTRTQRAATSTSSSRSRALRTLPPEQEESGWLETRRWRELDSNFRFPATVNLVVAPPLCRAVAWDG
jgi:hypothetical protein